MSEKISTPSPVSSRATSSRAGGQQLQRIVGRGDRQHLELRRPRAEHVRDRPHEALAEGVVRDDQDADHGGSRGPVGSALGGASAARLAADVSTRCRSAWPRAAGCRRRRLQAASSASANIAGDVEAGLLGDLDEAGRARHVDLGQVVADDVEADDQQALGPQRRPERRGDLAVARRQRPRHAAAAGGEVAARLAGLRDARQREGHRLAGDQQHALVAVDDLGHEALRHHRPRAVLADGLDDHVAVRVVGAHAEHRRAAHAVERLHDHVAVLVDEGVDPRRRRA